MRLLGLVLCFLAACGGAAPAALPQPQPLIDPAVDVVDLVHLRSYGPVVSGDSYLPAGTDPIPVALFPLDGQGFARDLLCQREKAGPDTLVQVEVSDVQPPLWRRTLTCGLAGPALACSSLGEVAPLLHADEGGGDVIHRETLQRWVAEVGGPAAVRLVGDEYTRPAPAGRYRVLVHGQRIPPQLRLVRLEGHRA